MRFIDHETPSLLPEKPWWALHASQVVEFNWTEPQPWPKEDALLKLLEDRMKESVNSWRRHIENMMFWEPAREALENGGCRQ